MPKLLKTPFAAEAAEGYRTDIQESTGVAPNSATYQIGFPPNTMQSIAAGGMPPKGSDLNGVLYDVTDNLVFLTQGGGYGFDSAYATSIGGYPLNAKLRLNDGTEVISTIANNTNDPNVNLTGWVKTNSASQILDESGLSQQEVNDHLSTASPYSANNYSTLQSAVDSSSIGNNININVGSYFQSVDLNKVNLTGKGYGTILNIDSNSYGIKSLQTLPNWDKMRISDISFKGQSLVGTVGFQFDPTDPVSGRRNLEYCTFENLNIAISKPTGNIGNSYSNLNIHDCNYGIKAQSVWSPLEMHSGNDTWRDFQMDSMGIWAFDYTDMTGGGAIHIKDGIIEYCNGGGIRLEYSDALPPFIPPRISNVWFEQVALATTVMRDGVEEIPRAIKLVNTAMCIIENCRLNNIELVNSTAIASKCRVDSNKIIIDATSNLIVEEAFLNGGAPKSLIIKSVAKQSFPSRFGGNLSLRTYEINGTQERPPNSTAAVGVTYNGNVGKKWSVDGSALVYATSILDDGTPCAKLDMTSGATYVLPQVITPANQWVVWGISAKASTGLTGSFAFNYDYNLGDVILEDDKWIHTFGIAKTPTTNQRIMAKFLPTSSGNLMLKDYFIVTFESEAEAIAFLNSRTSVNTYPSLIKHTYSGNVPANSEITANIDYLAASFSDTFVCSSDTYVNGVSMRAETFSQNVVKLHIRNETASPISLSSFAVNVKMV